MKSMMMYAAAVAALTTLASPAGAQPKPRFPIHRAPAVTPAAPVPAPAAQPAAPAAVEEAPPLAAPVGEVASSTLPALQTAPAQPEPAAAEPTASAIPAEPMLTLAAATTTAAVQAESAPATAPVYTMQSGDTLMGVTRRFRTTLSKLRALNDLPTDASIKAGQKIRLPADATDTGVEPFAKGPAPTLAAVRRPEPARPVLARPTPAPPAATPKPAVAAAAPTPLIKPAAARPVSTAGALPSTAIPTVTAAASPSTAMPTVTQPQPQPPVAVAAVSPPVRSLAPPVTAAAPPVRALAPPVAPAATASVPAMSAAASTAAPTDPVAAARGRFVWPVRGEVISGFGPKGPGQRNDGLNIAVREGDAVRAAADGEVVYAGDQVPGFGKLVLIKHDGGWVTAYAHLSEIGVKMKDRVRQSGEIGKAGGTGAVSSPQLHFEVRYAPSAKDKARPVDPMPLLPQ